MKEKLTVLLLMIGVMLFTISCSNGPEPILYSQDACDFCRMTIVDKQHAAQLVTVKGKNYKYDAIECMINDLSKWKRPPVETHLVADYATPGKLTDALTANYLISKEIPSPMGAFLTAFESPDKRQEIMKDTSGQKLNWEELKGEFDLN